MKNHQRIRRLNIRELAKLLIYSVQEIESDEGIDGEWVNYPVTYVYCPDGTACYSEEEAVRHTINWLNSKCDS